MCSVGPHRSGGRGADGQRRLDEGGREVIAEPHCRPRVDPQRLQHSVPRRARVLQLAAQLPRVDARVGQLLTVRWGELAGAHVVVQLVALEWLYFQ